MSSAVCSANGNRESVVLRIWCFGCTLFTFFAGTLIMGILAVLMFSASACTWNLAVRCFSVSRDMLGVISSAAQMWFLLAVMVALFAASIVQTRGALMWWSALIVVPVSILGVGVLPIGLAFLAKEALFDLPFFLVVSLVLFAGYQFSLLIAKLVGKLQS